MAEIKLEHIEKQYSKDGFRLKDINFEVKSGEFAILVGPSGCGKSTILRIIAGLETSDSGDLYFNDKRMNESEPKDRNIGMVFQNYALYPHLNVYDNIAFPLKIARTKKDIIESRVNDTAKLLGLQDYLTKKPKELSGGQRQRVALGRAIIRKPDLFLFDEPLSNLDAKLRTVMRSEIVNLHKLSGAASIYVTHDQTEAMTMGDKLIVLNKGEIMQIGSPDEIYNNPRNLFVASFLGSPQINILRGAVNDNEEFIFSINTKEYKLKVNLDKIIANSNNKYNYIDSLAFRPESLIPAINDMESYDIEIEIFNIENLGHEQILYFKNGEELLACRYTGFCGDIKRGGSVRLKLDIDKALAFDIDGNRV
jgi:multiple sugar transport system ATP-binding protein